jgi:hypothetical protein
MPEGRARRSGTCPARRAIVVHEQDVEPRTARVLDPVARISEILFGLIMALTFTGALSAATAGREEIWGLLVGMIGCNIAWGLVDAVMFLMQTLTERGHGLLTLRAVHDATDAREAHRIIAGAMPPVIRPLLAPEAYEGVRRRLLQLRDLPQRRTLTATDWLGALAVFLLVCLSTFPLVIPFIVFREAHLAIRVSNLVATVMLFLCGYWLARHAGYHPWRTGLGFVLFAAVLVAITIALGG